MCGRSVLMTVGRGLAHHFGLEEDTELEPRYNIAPTQVVAIVRNEESVGHRELKLVKWGLIPFWAKDTKIASRLINARAESVAEKPAFRAEFKNRPCLVPDDGFYEWKKTKGKKQPYFFGLANGQPLAFAGLWERWKAPEGDIIESCTILTTDANELLQPIHDRMPVILKPEDYDLWLDPKMKKPELVKPLLQPFPPDQMAGYPVSEEVNRADHEGPECVRPLDAEHEVSLINEIWSHFVFGLRDSQGGAKFVPFGSVVS